MTAPRKPTDIGNGLVCASFGAGGEWLSLATVHPEAGFVELTGLPLFAPEWRGDRDAVRRYRSWMRREEHAFLHVEAGRATIKARQDAPRGTRGLVQRLVISASRRDRPAGIRIRLNGRLGPPALAEISEVDPPPESGVKSRLKAREGTLRVSGDGGPVIVQAWLRKGGETPNGSAERRSDMRIAWKILRRRMPTAVAWIDWPGDAQEVHIDIACTFDTPAAVLPEWLDPTRRSPAPRSVEAARDELRPLLVPARLVKTLGRMNKHAASYTRGCTALLVGGAERVILTDHRILPLSWTRDAYWQARLLLATWSRGGHDEDERIVADHLRWLFLRCERPDGRWVRSHHADGRRKDHPLQADQQLYPLLELADYVRITGRLPQLPPEDSWAPLAEAAWTAAGDAIDATSGLIRTDENAADDVPADPFLLSDQVLLWHTSRNLAPIADQLGLDRAALLATATQVRAAFDAHFLVEGPLGPMWAYSVNGRGGFERYMDANDLPVALAPLWGFCKPTDAAWRTTMRFAFDPENPGFVAGSTGGLGSRHTPGTWSLGDIMGWVAFELMGETAAAGATLERLTQSAFSDGMLPEAYDPEGSGAAVRHWFAWPGAALGALVLDHAARDTGE
ncbi:MAG TPA: glycoside hydrolase family 125 protein [Anaerolineae bacterium]|nr:glycoside hydrolase family 125 protein [Anaerolineae bacterium]